MTQSLVVSFEVMTSDAAYELGIILVNSIHRVLSGPRHGRWYPVPGNTAYAKSTPKNLRAPNYYVKFTGTTNRSEIRGGAYQASAPGEPPASRTGRLRQSFNMVVLPITQTKYKVEIRTRVFYADDLEYGTDIMSPRPFVSVAVNNSMADLIKVIKKSQIKVLRNV